MTKLSHKLADLSTRVGDIEARAEAFSAVQAERRDQKVAQMKADVAARQDSLQATVQAKGDQVATAWGRVNEALRDKAEAVRGQIQAKKDAMDATIATRRAESLEVNARLAIDFALVAIEDADLAVAEAIDARLHADHQSRNSLARTESH